MKMSASMRVILDFVEAHERMILDRTPSILPAYMYANAVVSLFPSSIVMDALFLDLPVFLLGRDAKSSPEHPFYAALAHEDLGASSDDPERAVFAPLDVFLGEVARREDAMREARAAFRASEFPNPDGTVAEKILQRMKTTLAEGKP